MRSSHLYLSNFIARFALVIPLLFFNPAMPAEAGDLPAGPWVYLRAEMPPGTGDDLVEIIAVGDVMPGRGAAGIPGIFDKVEDTLRSADLVVGNLEGVMSADNASDHLPSLPIPSSRAAVLAEAGFDLLGLANNHALDAGQGGLAETAATLQAAGIQPLEGGSLVVRSVNNLKIGFLAWNDVPISDRSALFTALESGRSQADILIVLVHWGQEYQRHPNLSQRALADKLLAAGADLVLGSHPHVVQDLRVVRSPAPGERTGLVAYSLGNFVFDQGWDDTGQGLALRLFFDRSGLRAAQALPLWSALRPHWLTPAEASAMLERILPVERSGFTCLENSCRTREVPQEPLSGLFWTGALDFTGDGQPEFVRREGQAVEIYQEGGLAWRSPPEWRILDLALGDPNDDGRYELLLVLEKTGPAGNPTTHPFVVGYRGGIYRLIWGGSPVAARLYEVELGDVDGDGEAEVAIIEATEDGTARHLSLWRWHGWGFSLAWRSPPGNYHDLVFLPAEGDSPARLSVSVEP